MATISLDYGKLNNLTRRLGLTWEIDDREGFDPHEPTILLITASGERNHDPLDLGGAVDALQALFELGILTDLEQQPAALQRLGALEKRVSELEESLLQHRTTADKPDTAQEADVNLRELCARAEAIGTYIYVEGEKIYYERRRSMIPGTHYKFYFTVDNALDRGRKQFRANYAFVAPDELEELARWIAHDEEIFAECNRKYAAPQD